MGTFRNAIPLNTKVFSETFDRLRSLLREVPKETRVLTFCTGGIRCVKVNAYLSQHLGYSNTATLKDGIVGYKKWLLTDKSTDIEDVESNPIDNHSGESSSCAPSGASTVFEGDNYVFDRRRVQQMTPPPSTSDSRK